MYNMYPGTYMASQQATLAASSASNEAFEAQQAEHDLRIRVEHLAVVCRAMWSFIESSQGVTLKDLEARMLEVEKQHPDHQGVVTCPNCHRPTGLRTGVCIYCGAPVGDGDPFTDHAVPGA